MVVYIISIFLIFLVYLYFFLKFAKFIQPENKQKKTYFLYYKQENIVKIGFTNDVWRRKKQIEYQYLIKLEVLKILNYNAENQLRKLFKEEWLGKNYKYGTEWHVFSENIKNFIKIN